MSNPKAILDQLGPDAVSAIAERVGRSSKAVRNRAAGLEALFPAAWFEQINMLCEERGVDCPTSAFAFQRETDAA